MPPAPARKQEVITAVLLITVRVQKHERNANEGKDSEPEKCFFTRKVVGLIHQFELPVLENDLQSGNSKLFVARTQKDAGESSITFTRALHAGLFSGGSG